MLVLRCSGEIVLQNFLATTYTTSFPHVDSPPDIEIAGSKYLIRFARNAEEIEAALKLRFEVFNLELEEGLESSFQTGRSSLGSRATFGRHAATLFSIM